jgi:hypothetical protein
MVEKKVYFDLCDSPLLLFQRTKDKRTDQSFTKFLVYKGAHISQEDWCDLKGVGN